MKFSSELIFFFFKLNEDIAKSIQNAMMLIESKCLEI